MPASRPGWRTSAKWRFPLKPSRVPSPMRWNSPTMWMSAKSSCVRPRART